MSTHGKAIANFYEDLLITASPLMPSRRQKVEEPSSLMKWTMIQPHAYSQVHTMPSNRSFSSSFLQPLETHHMFPRALTMSPRDFTSGQIQRI
eukprot:scaffold15576_cov51-Cyclotella_meneghiniana.AAC.1